MPIYSSNSLIYFSKYRMQLSFLFNSSISYWFILFFELIISVKFIFSFYNFSNSISNFSFSFLNISILSYNLFISSYFISIFFKIFWWSIHYFSFSLSYCYKILIVSSFSVKFAYNSYFSLTILFISFISKFFSFK